MLLSLALSACAAPTARPRPRTPAVVPPIPAAERMIIVVTLDGVPAWALEDPRTPAPTLRRLAREGAAAERMTVVNPAMTWPNHATLATGVPAARHGLLHNGRLERPGGRQPLKVVPRPREALLRVPTVYDLASARGLRVAQVGWIPPQAGGTVAWSFREHPEPGGATEADAIAAGLLGADDVATFGPAPVTWRDEIWMRVAAHLITSKRPHLLFLHLLNTDSVHHQFGPLGLPSLSAIALADMRVAELLRAVEAAGMSGRTTLFVLSDHGFRGIRRAIRPNALLAAEGLLEAVGAEITASDVQVIPEGGTAMVYVTEPGRRAELVPRVEPLLARLEGVARVVRPEQFPGLGLPRPEESDQAPDLLLVAKPDYGFFGSPEGPPVAEVGPGMALGHHGYLASDPAMDAIFFAWGYGVRRGAHVETVPNVAVAPTVAALLGFEMPGVTGRPLTELLDPARLPVSDRQTPPPAPGVTR